MLLNVALLSYLCAALAFLALGVGLHFRSAPNSFGSALRIPAFVAAAWAALIVIGWFAPPAYGLVIKLAESARDVAWTLLVLRLLHPAGTRFSVLLRSALGRFGLALYALLVIVTVLFHTSSLLPFALGAALELACQLGAAVLGMVLIEQMLRNSATEDRWGVKFAALAIGGMFAYDFYLYSNALLFQRLDVDIWSARGLMNALTVPFLLISTRRTPGWHNGLALSRNVVFHSVSISGAALYLLLMGSAGYYLRYAGGNWGPVIQVGFLCAAVLLLGAIFFSGSFRARLRVFISKHFYRYHYDYREVWLQFTSTLSEPGPDLERRALCAVAALVESPAGMLLMRTDAQRIETVMNWNMHSVALCESVDTSLWRFSMARRWVIDLAELRAEPERYPDLVLPAGLQALADAWLVVPLVNHGDLIGLMILTRPRTPVRLNWEVTDLLKIAGQQAASYLAQKRAADGLAVSRQFESFNRMSTFVVHDLKNLVSQLSLLVSNAARHSGSPEFQADMLETVSHSVDRMKLLLQKFTREIQAERTVPIVLQSLLQRCVTSAAAWGMTPRLALPSTPVTVSGNSARLERVIGHLLQNAIEATPKDGTVRIELFQREQSAEIEVRDNGAGMSEEFVRDRLFKPFESTKPAGMGIGVFESRQYIQELGGSVTVRSSPGRGTTFVVRLPLYTEPGEGLALPAR